MITLITPTGDRPEAFALCERWVAAQTYRGRRRWVVVDDGQEPTRCAMDQIHVRRRREESDPRHTLPVQLMAALPHIRGEWVAFIEDDDWRHCTWLERCMGAADPDADLIGEPLAAYYWPRQARYYRNANTDHASLTATVMNARLIPMLIDLIRADPHDPKIDLRLWAAAERRVMLDVGFPLVVGMKNIAGRPSTLGSWKRHPLSAPDADWRVLRRWLADDAEAYLGPRRAPVPGVGLFEAGGGQDPRPWLIVGKGPSVDRIGSVDLSARRVIALNDAILAVPSAEACLFSELDILRRPGVVDAMAERAGLVLIGDPARDPLTGELTPLGELVGRFAPLDELIRRAPVDRFEWFDSAPCRPGVITSRYTSAEAALHIAALMGARAVETIGVDGGTEYGSGFAPNADPAKRQNFDRQFPMLDAVAALYGIPWRRL